MKLLLFFLDLQLTGMIQKVQNTAISKHFTKSVEYTLTTSGTIFSTDIWINQGIFQYKPGACL